MDDGDILTATGTAVALDLGLHVVRRDHGAGVANSVSHDWSSSSDAAGNDPLMLLTGENASPWPVG